jgi:hypothetical protein
LICWPGYAPGFNRGRQEGGATPFCRPALCASPPTIYATIFKTLRFINPNFLQKIFPADSRPYEQIGGTLIQFGKK